MFELTFGSNEFGDGTQGEFMKGKQPLLGTRW
jgi:hypothetical protein